MHSVSFHYSSGISTQPALTRELQSSLCTAWKRYVWPILSGVYIFFFQFSTNLPL